MTDPQIYLAVDNCFASKRWPHPAEWLTMLAEWDVHFAEAGADTECDALYNGPDYLNRWAEETLRVSRSLSCRVANLYSGHGSYATLGLCHPDRHVGERFLREWLRPMFSAAAKLEAGMGFFCHAFADSELAESARYEAQCELLFERLAEAASLAAQCGCGPVSVEQMYSPQQYPWRIADGERLLREGFRRCGDIACQLTVDVGHQFGQRYYCAAADVPNHLRATACDGDPYEWLRALGCYSPIIHLQQTDNRASAHHSFLPRYNQTGIITPEKVLRAIAESYARRETPGMPPRNRKIFLTLELFFSPAVPSSAVRDEMRQSIDWWRQAIPEDALPLSRLLA